MPFVRPILPELRDRIRQDFAARLPGADAVLRESNLRVVADVLAELSAAQFDYETWLSQQFFVDTCETVYLDRMASIWGVAREQPTTAAGAIAVTGTPGAAVPATMEWQTFAGVFYQATAGVTAPGVQNQATVAAPGIAGGADLETDEHLRTRLLLRIQQPPQGGAAS